MGSNAVCTWASLSLFLGHMIFLVFNTIQYTCHALVFIFQQQKHLNPEGYERHLRHQGTEQWWEIKCCCSWYFEWLINSFKEDRIICMKKLLVAFKREWFNIAAYPCKRRMTGKHSSSVLQLQLYTDTGYVYKSHMRDPIVATNPAYAQSRCLGFMGISTPQLKVWL